MRKLARRVLEARKRLLPFTKRHPPVGAMPGTLVPAPDAAPPVIRVISYDLQGMEDRTIAAPDDLVGLLEGPKVAWIDVQGFGDDQVLRRIGDLFALHPLALEDAVNVPQRPKSEAYEEQHLFITRMARLDVLNDLDSEQVSIFIGPRYVLTLQERHGDVFDPVRRRIVAGKGPIRRMGPDYLAYALIDTVIDGYYPLIEALGDRLYDLEEEIMAGATPGSLRRIHRMRRTLLAIRRAVWPQREAVSALIRDPTPLVTNEVRQYLRDCQDHAVQIADVLDTYREITASLMDMYLSSVGQRTNEVMKVLTIMASIFIPLTFLAGLYGMNFDVLPELHLPWAYPALLGVMAVLAGGMLVAFRRRGWLGGGDHHDEGDPES